MQAMILRSYGADSVFEPAELPKPERKPGHVVVRVAATSVNTVDTMIRHLGSELPLSPALPAVLGMDFAGTVEAVGEGVTRFAIGDEVYGCAGGLLSLQGALAEYIVADAQLIAHKPESLSMREAAALPLVGITAHEGLTRAGVRADQSVLIQGGAGGVGHVAVQLARHLGARVFATGTGDEKLALIEKLGAHPIDYEHRSPSEYVAEHTGGTGFDVVFDTVGGANMTNSFEATKLNGHVSSTVALAQLDLSPAHFKGLSVHVVFMLIPMIHDVGRQEHGNILESLARTVDAGALSPVVDTPRYELSQVGEAHARLASGEVLGKVVIEVP